MKNILCSIVLIVLIISLSGCMGDKEISSSINIPNINDYTVLYIQSVDKNGAASESTSKYITDKNDIETFIKKINKMEVIKPSNKKFINKSKELNKQGNYMIVLSDSKKMDHEMYSMIFYEDGSIHFESEDENKIIYVSKKKHPSLLKELKSDFHVTF